MVRKTVLFLVLLLAFSATGFTGAETDKYNNVCESVVIRLGIDGAKGQEALVRANVEAFLFLMTGALSVPEKEREDHLIALRLLLADASEKLQKKIVFPFGENGGP
jgi:hypothetical protein